MPSCFFNELPDGMNGQLTIDNCQMKDESGRVSTSVSR